MDGDGAGRTGCLIVRLDLWLEKVVAPITCQEFSYEMNELSSDAMDEILDLIYGGQKIMAIKRYTEMRDVCLVESMQLVVQLTNRLRVESRGNLRQRQNPVPLAFLSRWQWRFFRRWLRCCCLRLVDSQVLYLARVG